MPGQDDGATAQAKRSAPKGSAPKRGTPKAEGAASTRRAYHHGDLRNALVEAGLQRVREGGPDAMVLREVARATGVSSTAAYRHFASHQDLVDEVKHEAMRLMAETVRAELAALPSAADPASEAVRTIRASGYGYVRFALAEPGLFRLIFRKHRHAAGTDAPPADPRPDGAADGAAGTGPMQDPSYAMMAGALDVLVEQGVLSPERRAFTDVALWAAVHGIATLLLETGLTQLPEPAREAAIARVFDVLFHGVLEHPVGAATRSG